jgi:endonuclease/exonuclease/phosphatase family metal-dependent hydrolase
MFRILSCNIRKSDADDGKNSWHIRKDICRDIIMSRRADIICFQEMRVEQFQDMLEVLRGYKCYFLPKTIECHNPINAIFFRSSRLDLVVSGGYWLSETPHIPGTSSWGSASIRLANWVILKEVFTGKIFRVINTHLDHISEEAKLQQTQMIINDTLQGYVKDFPHILTGDLNSDLNHRVVQSLTEAGFTDSSQEASGSLDPGYTFHGFEGKEYRQKNQGKIDWIMMKGSVKSLEASVIKESINGYYPSDHYFLDVVFDIHNRLSERKFDVKSLFSRIPA